MSARDREPGPEDADDLAPEAPVRAASLDRVLLDWRGAQQRVTDYLEALGLEPREVRRLARLALERALGRDSRRGAVRDAMDEVPGLLLETHPLPGPARAAAGDDAFLRWRLAARQAGGAPCSGLAEPEPLRATPPLRRGAMASERFLGRRLGEWRRRRPPPSPAPPDPTREERRRARRAWGRRGRLRRILLALLVVAPSVLAGAAFLATLPARVWLPAEIALSVSFGALFGWISVGFWTSLFGFLVLLRGGDRFAITRAAGAPAAPLDAAARTALIMPVCDEPVARVFAGLRAMRASLARAGAAHAFDFFILSDSVDPDVCADEEAAWADFRREAAGGGGIYYRRRRVRRKRKSGNVADFCRRFGSRYRYMVVLDADSVMTGETLARLVQLMEAHPHVGVIQTAPRVVRARSLFARVQQFASRLYGPMFAAGMHFWQLGDSPYWGHNAILRVEPFMRHCALPRLSGRPPFGGDILSHDFVEAALLGRAGWSIWLAFDLPGSWEETPGSLLEEMQRDKRWCQGNLQHLRLLFTEGLSPAHRALFFNGIFSYVSAVLWLGFLVASTGEAVMWALRGPDYFAAGQTLFPTWPVWRPERVRALFTIVLVVLFLPKLLAVVLALVRRESAGYGGVPSLLRSVLVESLSSALFAPIHMAFYCRFVLLNLLGRAVGWGGGADEIEETSWRQAWRRHGPDTAVACAWAAGIYWLHPSAFWWLAPVAGALVFSVPLSVLASRIALGERASARGWCVTPEESVPPRELRELRELESAAAAPRPAGAAARTGFVGAAVDPLRNALHVALLRGSRSHAPAIREARAKLLERALAGGPEALSVREKRVVLSDAALLGELHARVWSLEQREAVVRWGLAGTVRGSAVAEA
jgi:membrane glycosyltransferase